MVYVVKYSAFKNFVCKTQFPHQLTGAGLIMDHGRSVRLNVEEEVKRGLGPAVTLLQHMVELTALAALNNLKHVTLNLVQVGLKLL